MPNKKDEQSKSALDLQLITPEFGKVLLQAAAEKQRQAAQDSVIARVQELLTRIQNQKEYIKQCERNLELLQAKVKAIETGAFSIDSHGIVHLSDEQLNKEEVRMAECVNCGYSLRRSATI